MCEVVLTM